MAEQPNKTEQKGTGGFLSEWFGLWTNRIKRWPLIRRFRFGRKQVGDRPVPIAYELDKKGWFKLNQNIFGTNLQTIEKYWDEEMALYGFGGDKEYIDGNPGGIIPIYKRFGVYSDIDRIKNEVQWFEHGTGYETEDITFEIPEDEREWKKNNWDRNTVRALLRDPSQPWKKNKYPRIKLGSGIVYHEGKMEYKEELYILGHDNI